MNSDKVTFYRVYGEIWTAETLMYAMSVCDDDRLKLSAATEDIDPELLAKVLANPEMRALLSSLARTMK